MAKYDATILPQELKPQKISKWQQLKNNLIATFDKRRVRKYIVRNVGRPLGAPTYNPLEGGMVTTETVHPDYLAAMLKPRGEVIVPLEETTPEEICELMSQAACDHEFLRVIVYPIEGDRRQKVMKIIKDTKTYPMYEYLEANITNNDDLDSKTIIYKYGGQSHVSKPV